MPNSLQQISATVAALVDQNKASATVFMAMCPDGTIFTSFSGDNKDLVYLGASLQLALQREVIIKAVENVITDAPVDDYETRN